MELKSIKDVANLQPGTRVLLFDKTNTQDDPIIFAVFQNFGFLASDWSYQIRDNAYTHYCIAPEFPKKLTKFEQYHSNRKGFPQSFFKGDVFAEGVKDVLEEYYKAGQEAGPEESTNTEPEDNISKIISRVESGTREDYWFMNNHFSKDGLVKFLKNLKEVFKV